MEELIPGSKPPNSDRESEKNSDKNENSEESPEDKTVTGDTDNDDVHEESFSNKIDDDPNDLESDDEDLVLKDTDKRESLAWDHGGTGPPNFAASTPIPGASGPITSTLAGSTTPASSGSKSGTITIQ